MIWFVFKVAPKVFQMIHYSFPIPLEILPDWLPDLGGSPLIGSDGMALP